MASTATRRLLHLHAPRTGARLFSTTTPSRQSVTFNLQAQGTGVSQRITIPDSPHAFTTDTYPAFGGSDSAPSPLHFNLASLSSCTQVTASIVAKEQGITLGQWDVRVSGDLDPRVLVAGAQGNANWTGVSLTVTVQTDAPEGQAWDAFVAEVERRCPVTQLLKRSGAGWTSVWTRADL